MDETLVATTRYRQALTRLDDESVRRPSGLPGWSRAHVIAHVSRNADAFTRVLEMSTAGQPASMYESQEARDAEIEETVGRLDLAGLVADARHSCTHLEEAWRRCDADPATSYARIPGGLETFGLHTVGGRRRAEVEIHHADLDLGYSPAGWPCDFSVRMVRQRQDEMAGLVQGCPSMVLSSTDVPGLWTFGVGQGPQIDGAVGDLAFWLVGRGGGRGLTSSSGELPTLGRWR